MPRRRVAVLFERLGPYHVARLRACGSYFDPIAVEFYGRDSTYAWDPVAGAEGFARLTVLPVQVADVRGVIGGVSATLDSIGPDAVGVPGWSHPGALAAMQWCARSGVPFVLMADSFEAAGRGKAVRRWIKRRVVKMAGAALVAGTVHQRFIATLGLQKELTFTGYDVVDNRHFARRTVAEDPGRSADPYLLTVSRFIPEKNLGFLLEAYAEFVSAMPESRLPLVIVGDGPERSMLEARIRSLAMERVVRLPGFRQYDDLPSIYAGARAFILPSVFEPWGLVVNEAMAAGLPVLVSTSCGCAADLVREGINGFTFDPRDQHGLARLLGELARDELLAARMGAAGRDMIAAWSPDLFGRNLAAAVEAALRTPRRSPGLVERLTLDALIRAKKMSGRQRP